MANIVSQLIQPQFSCWSKHILDFVSDRRFILQDSYRSWLLINLLEEM